MPTGRTVFVFLVLGLLVLGSGVVVAQTLVITDAGPEAQVAALTTSQEATYNDPSGRFVPMPNTSLTVQLRAESLLVIKFSARGTVAPPTQGKTIPIVFMRCEIDNQPCQPDVNAVEFLYPEFCCDSRAFLWVGHRIPTGAHKITILWGMGNPTTAVVTNRTLVVEASTRPRTHPPER